MIGCLGQNSPIADFRDGCALLGNIPTIAIVMTYLEYFLENHTCGQGCDGCARCWGGDSSIKLPRPPLSLKRHSWFTARHIETIRDT